MEPKYSEYLMDLQELYPNKTAEEIIKMAQEEMEKAETRYESWKENEMAYE